MALLHVNFFSRALGVASSVEVILPENEQGIGVTAAGGTLLHFLYDWLGEAVWIAPFSGINESTWEHMKLLFWSTFIFAIVQGRFFGEKRDFWCVKLRGMIVGLGLIPIIFYTYNGAIGKSPDWLNIAIFFISAASAYIYEARLFKSERVKCRAPWLAFAALALIGLLFVIFTFRTPELGIFLDPITGDYGM